MFVFDHSVEVVQSNEKYIEFYLNVENRIIKIQLNSLEVNKAAEIYTYDISDKVILRYNPTEKLIFMLYVFNGKVYAVLENLTFPFNEKSSTSYQIVMENNYETVIMKQLGVARLGIVDSNGDIIHYIEDFITGDQLHFEIEYDMGFTTTEYRYATISIASYDIYHIVLTYDLFRKEFIVRKVLIKPLKRHDDICLKLISNSNISVSNKVDTKEVNFGNMNKGKRIKIFNLNEVKGANKENILSLYSINKARYFIYATINGIYISKSNPYKVTGHKSSLKIVMTNKSLFIYGRNTHYAHQADGQYDCLYLQNSENKLTNFVRPFNSIKLLNRYGFFRIPIQSLYVNERIHNNLYIGNDEFPIHNLRRKENDKKAKTLSFKRHKEHLNVMRTNLHGNITSTIVPFTEEYSLLNRMKIKLAYFVSKLNKKTKKNINLFFEKKSEKADESGFRVFEKIKSSKLNSSENLFIINGKTQRYTELKKDYGASIIKKYSLKHYLSIFRANYFIASELSNHLLNDRLYIDQLRSQIMSVPLIFLQHGIMFAKPVDNPMAFGFHKDKNLYNMYKTVISSELEANEFYKMGYERDDLILTGLAALDYAKLDQDADKIAYMPTYRYWEEGLIYNNDIKSTSYYKSIMKIIDAFEEAGLLNRLLIVPHNKFSQFIYENMPAYKQIIGNNPSEALKKCRIFITDYSSAIYDATFRGAYPIFYWEEKDYLINKYKGIPPVNEENAPGPIAYSTQELVNIVRNAINNNYILEDDYKARYLKINKYSDRKNTDRIVQFLMDGGII